ncbi:hypothetical protein KL86DYS2_11640 [uncultured Dysgonomonas sp.]|uniref:Uncharacterized protein n=1 Tax=uncultured Dysgonomonas sp. TaxID=206096 RepID=A0A212JIY0_9BACT|nr:hypothetical protein KL86DYS2_11640 [uncultured Dysgonomonas sp.]
MYVKEVLFHDMTECLFKFANKSNSFHGTLIKFTPEKTIFVYATYIFLIVYETYCCINRRRDECREWYCHF